MVPLSPAVLARSVPGIDTSRRAVAWGANATRFARSPGADATRLVRSPGADATRLVRFPGARAARLDGRSRFGSESSLCHAPCDSFERKLSVPATFLAFPEGAGKLTGFCA